MLRCSECEELFDPTENSVDSCADFYDEQFEEICDEFLKEERCLECIIFPYKEVENFLIRKTNR